LQFFFCTNESEEPCYINWYGDPFAQCQVVRIVNPKGPASPPTLPTIDDYFPAKRIVGWSESDDFPSHPEREELGLVYDDNSLLKWSEKGVEAHVSVDDYFEWSEDHTYRDCKLAGWPAWVQNVEYAKCSHFAKGEWT